MIRYVLFLLFLTCLSCNSSSQEDSTRVEPKTSSSDASRVTQITPLRIWTNVDSTSILNEQSIACLRRFFENKLNSELENDYWYKADIERFQYPYGELIYSEYDENGQLGYLPTLMKISPTGIADERLLTVKWAANDSTGTAADIRYVYDFLARNTAEGIRLSVPLDHRTREWERINVGPVHYIVSPEHEFSRAEAEQQAAQIEVLSEFFEIPSFPIIYYSCAGPSDLFRARGFQYHLLMYVHESGGMVDHGKNVFSGNDKDIYTHEIVHLFTERKFGERASLIDEGIATILGGSGERAYKWHRANMKYYLTTTPNVDLSDRTNPHIQDYIAEHTSVPYMVGALICEHVFRKAGKEGIFELLRVGRDPWPALVEYGLTEENITTELRKELALPMAKVR